jgi:transposase InsO family protein
MPWRNLPVCEQRLVLVNLIDRLGYPVAQAAREAGVSRKTAYKWLGRWRADPQVPLLDQSRRPHRQPRRTAAALEEQVLLARERYGWGARKLRALLKADGLAMPSIPTVHQVLRRGGQVGSRPQPAPPPQRFERSHPNELWQLDHKGPVEIGRQKRYPLTILDDHSRYLLSVEPCPDLSMSGVWAVLWEVLGQAGLPQAILCDHAFSVRQQNPGTLSRFEVWLLRLGIDPLHGRPYHPQTQGKAERIHGTYERELYRRVRFDSDEHFRQDAYAWRQLYNTRRPHEALDDRPPVCRWQPSPRQRPQSLPPMAYPAGALLRSCDAKGTIYYANRRIAVGEGLAGEQVRVEEGELEVRVYYGPKQLRAIPVAHFAGDRSRRL